MLPLDLTKLQPPTLPTSGTKIKHVIARWIVLLIMNDGGCSLIFAKVINPNTINATTKSSCITHPMN